ncbi:MAG: amidase family protein [Pirellulaceae bacterium]|nr:amidase family protein [Pirellulaceae bacterium]
MPSDPLVTDLSASEIAGRIGRQELRAIDVLEAFICRIEKVNSDLNAVVVDRFEEARQEAISADAAIAAGQSTGVLHGVPVTIKEMFDVVGLPTTAGLTTLRHHRATKDAVVVSRLRQAGAIVMAKTNVPQLGMTAESDNPVYGCTNNPWDVTRGPGGSSGGEAAIIAAGGSPLGLGSDGAGSIRFPAHVCGICGFKPTGGQLSMQGHRLSANWPSDWVQPGPLSHSVDDLILAMEVLTATNARNFDEVALPLSNPKRIDLSKLRVGVYDELESLPVAPAVKRAVHEARAKLVGQGVETVAYRPACLEEIWALYTRIFYAEGLSDIHEQLRGSTVDWRTRNYLRLARIPALFRPLAAAVATRIGQQRLGATLSNLRRSILNAKEYSRLLTQVREFRRRFQRELADQRIDALIAPPAPIAAFYHGDFYANYALIYNGVYNLLGVPAGTAHVTCVRPDEQSVRESRRDLVDRSMARSEAGSSGLPVGVQVISTRWRDDRVLALLKAIHQPIRAPRSLS